MAAESSARSGASADSYIGSLISLTSKFEIRYEGVLYNINTEESSIGLRNVRSFGTEGRKKDGPQIPASDKIYEYILFRGSDIKDLQVKSSPPIQPAPAPAPIHNDPAIIQSHYPHPALASTSLPSVGSVPVADHSSQAAQLGLPRSTFQGSLPPYQPGATIGSWGSSPPLQPANGSGLAMPMYWQGYYAPPSGLPHLQQPPLMRPPPGMPLHHSMQQPLQYPPMNTSLPSVSPNLQEFPPPLLPPVSSTPSVAATLLPATSAPTQASVSAPETSASVIPNKPPATSLPASTLNARLPFVPLLTSSLESVPVKLQPVPANIDSKPRTVPIPNIAYQSLPQTMPSTVGSTSSSQVEKLVPLVTPGQLLQPAPPALPSQPLEASPKDVELEPPEAKIKSSEPSVLGPADMKDPILPLPTPNVQKTNGAFLHAHQSSRGRGRGRENGYSRPVTKFTEDFDFTAMNEKFKKDEVWGHLGKNKSQFKDGDGDDDDDGDDEFLEEDGTESLKHDTKPVYVKDDFFDSISCNALDHGMRNGRARFSEQLKLDTETFGDFARNRPFRGGGRGFRGGRSRGSYYGRGYGYTGRGRGQTGPSQGSY